MPDLRRELAQCPHRRDMSNPCQVKVVDPRSNFEALTHIVERMEGVRPLMNIVHKALGRLRRSQLILPRRRMPAMVSLWLSRPNYQNPSRPRHWRLCAPGSMALVTNREKALAPRIGSGSGVASRMLPGRRRGCLTMDGHCAACSGGRAVR
jgi:hypothetical protein